MASAFLGGAKNRLLPASIPFRFFASASIFHVVAWITLGVGATNLPGFTGGPGANLASLHLLTLGVMTMSVMGASYQLLPVATGKPISRKWAIKWSFWLFTPGVLVLSWGMYEYSPMALYLGSGAVGIGLLIFTLLTAINLSRALSAMPVVTAHGWGAIAALPALVVLGILLVIDFETGILANHQKIAGTHMILAIFGFLGLFVFGFSQILIPMFLLSRSLPARLGWFELIISTTAILSATIANLMEYDRLLLFSLLLALIACLSYLRLMQTALQTAMRKRQGLSFIIIRTSWGLLIIAMITGLAVFLDAPIANGMTLFGFLLLAGWLLTFLMAILQRIMPFLASMHAIGKNRSPPLLSQLTPQRPLIIHAICHFCAIIACSIGIVLNSPTLIQLGSILGVAGALTFTYFTGFIIWQLTHIN